LVSLICLLLVFAGVIGNHASAAASDAYTEIDEYITTAIKRHNIPGIALAITRGDVELYSKGYGTAGAGRPVSADTPFYLGSISKSFTALAVMQLVEQGQLELDAPVQTYLPWFMVADEQASQQITIRHLLQHTSGLSYAGYTSNLPADSSLEMLVRDLSRARSNAPTGSKMQYFNPGYDTLGLIIETMSGQSYGDYLSEHVFGPLGMKRTFTDAAAAKEAGLTQGYAQIFMFDVPMKQPVKQYDLPAGFIISTANDMARYLTAMNNGGVLDGFRVLKPESVELMFTPNSEIGSTYGFGWQIYQANGETNISHGGDTERFHTNMLLLPEKNLSIVMLINQNHMIKDFSEYTTLFSNVVNLLSGNPSLEEKISSTVYGSGLFIIWLVILALAVRKVVRLPQWRAKMLTWDARQRQKDILKHLFSIVITIVIVVFVAPAILKSDFSLEWFVALMPDVAIIIATLILDDLLQVVLKLLAMSRNKLA
jgi:CubicO group peptidase (beta-lactamase class C family)